MKELLICALKRHGKPGTAGDILDTAVALAQAHGWARNHWPQGAQQVAALLKGMAERKDGACRRGTRPENGRNVPLFEPFDRISVDESPGLLGGDFNLRIVYDPAAPMPEEPDDIGESHPLNGKTRAQQFAVFNVYDRSVETISRHYNELLDFEAKVHRDHQEMIARHRKGLAELDERVRRLLTECGIEAPN